MAVFSAGSGGVAALLTRRMANFAPARHLISVNFALMFCMLLPAAPFFWQFDFSWQAFGLFLLAALLDAAANLFYFLSFEHLPAVTTTALLALSPIISLALQPFLVPGFRLRVLNVGGIILVVCGLVLLTRNGVSGESSGPIHPRQLAYPLLAALFFGINVFPVRTLMANEWVNPYTYYLLRALLVTLISALILRPKLGWVSFGRLTRMGSRLVFGITQWLLLLAALGKGNPAVVKTLADTSPLFVVALAGAVLGEKVGWWQGVGAVLTVAGMVLAVR